MEQKLRSGKLFKIFSTFFISLVTAIFTSAVHGQAPNAWVNELHYANSGGGTGKFIEVVVENPEQWDLSSLSLTIYSDSDGGVVNTIPLDTFEQGSSTDNYTFYYKSVPGLQDQTTGLALDHSGELIRFISFGGTLTGRNGPADGKKSQDIGIHEPDYDSDGKSLQLKGVGVRYNDFSWSSPTQNSPGEVNKDQFLHPVIQFAGGSSTVSERSRSVSVSITLIKPDGYEVSAEVEYQPELSTASPEDFSGDLTKSVTFSSNASGRNTQRINFDLEDDSDYEGKETAVFKLTNISTSGKTRIGAPETMRITITDNDRPDIVINEFLVSTDEDVDGNGSTDNRSDDKFVEFLNNETRAVDISGWQFSDNGVDIKHTFPSGTVIPASNSLVLFNKDDDGEPQGIFGGAIVQSSDFVFNLDGSGGTPTILDGSGNKIDSYSYGSEGGDDQSLVRNPEGSGRFVKHGSVSISLYSPGTRSDGTNFTNSITIQGNGGWHMLAAPFKDMSITDIADDAPVQGYPNHNSGSAKNFYTDYDGTAFNSDKLSNRIEGKKFSAGKGFMLYLFNDDQTRPPVTLEASSGTEHDRDVTVPLHSEGDGWNLLGNPFETAVNISDINSWVNGSGTLQSNVGQIWDNSVGSYLLTSLNDGRVGSWRGFFIENADARSLDIPTSAKVNASQQYEEAVQQGYLALTLKGQSSSDDITTTDRAAVLYFHEEATHGWDIHDAKKLLPLTSRYALLGFRALNEEENDNQMLLKSQDSRPYDFEGEISYDVELNVKNVSGQFELSWSTQNIPENWRFTLIDNETGNQVNMNTTGKYSFSYATREKAVENPNESKLERSIPDAITATPQTEQQPRFTIKAQGENKTAQSDEAPDSIKLNPNYPNPFNPSTTITFELAKQAEVKLNVYTIVGQKVATLVDGSREAGVHEESWNASDMPSGIYIAQLEVDGKVYIRKMTLIK